MSLGNARQSQVVALKNSLAIPEIQTLSLVIKCKPQLSIEGDGMEPNHGILDEPN